VTSARAASAHFVAAQRAFAPPAERPTAMDHVLERLERDSAAHLGRDVPDDDASLDHLEARLGRRLPADLRRLIGLFGGCVLYDQNEIFGTRRLLVHDIEMVPDLLSVRRRLGLPADLVPFHRADGVTHAVDLRQATETATPVIALGRPERYASLAEFLDAVVRPGPPGR
jgi:hypothetical protein